MLITGSCGIRLVVPLSCRRAVRLSLLLARCLPPYALTLRPRHLIISCLAACRFPLRALGSCLSLLRPRHRCRCRCRPIASRLPPRFIDTTGGEIRRGCGGSLGSACLPLGSPSHPCVRHRMATGRGCLPSLDCSCLSPWPSSVPPATYPISSSSYRLIALPPRSLDTGDGAGVLGFGCLPLLFNFTCGRFARVLWRTAAVVVLLAWVSYYVCCRWGDAVARRCVSGL